MELGESQTPTSQHGESLLNLGAFQRLQRVVPVELWWNYLKGKSYSRPTFENYLKAQEDQTDTQVT